MKEGIKMTKEQFIKTLLKKKDLGFLKITLNDGHTCTLGNGSDFMFGWDENEWGCDILYMISYNSFEEVVHATADYIYDELVTWKKHIGQAVISVEPLVKM